MTVPLSDPISSTNNTIKLVVERADRIHHFLALATTNTQADRFRDRPRNALHHAFEYHLTYCHSPTHLLCTGIPTVYWNTYCVLEYLMCIGYWDTYCVLATGIPTVYCYKTVFRLLHCYSAITMIAFKSLPAKSIRGAVPLAAPRGASGCSAQCF